MVLCLSWVKGNKLLAKTSTLIRWRQSRDGTACFRGPCLGLLKSVMEHSSVQCLSGLNVYQSLNNTENAIKEICRAN